MTEAPDPNAARKTWMGLLAKSSSEDLAAAWATAGLSPEFEILRHPEIGSVMVRGRAGAVGTAFNLGEITVTRCSIRLATGEDGHGYVQGRDKKKAIQAALIDAIMQTDDATTVTSKILAPLSATLNDRKSTRAAKAAATKVEFFTMVRGED
jgi:alpha-D-ribose 1-methylphosphonate 5-triphosphate synthase subunit PhnG